MILLAQFGFIAFLFSSVPPRDRLESAAAEPGYAAAIIEVGTLRNSNVELRTQVKSLSEQVRQAHSSGGAPVAAAAPCANGQVNNSGRQEQVRLSLGGLRMELPDQPLVPQLLVGVLSRPAARKRREAIRMTWALVHGNPEWRLLFVVADDQHNIELRNEKWAHGDMLIVEVMDTPRNDPRKVAALYHAAQSAELFPASGATLGPAESSCGQFPCWVLTVHDQAFVDVPLVLSMLKAAVASRTLYSGTVVQSAGLVLRDGGVYSESVEDFNAERWPPYASGGTGYVMGADLVACALKQIADPSYRHLHVEDASTGVLAQKCGAKPDSKLEGMIVSLMGTADEALETSLRAKMNNLSRENPDDLPYHFNKHTSRLLGELRPNFPELRDPRCAALLPKADELAADGWDTSVIITFVEEEPTTLVRTVRTLIKNTPAALLREILLVDDGSSKKWLDQMYPSDSNSIRSAWPPGVKPARVLDYIVAIDPSKIRVVHAGRQGFIKARMVGIRETKARTYTIMESHCEPLPGWLEPLLAALVENPETIANPIINQIAHEDFSWHRPAYSTMDYNDRFEMVWGWPGTLNDKVNKPASVRPAVEPPDTVPWGNPDPNGTNQYMPFASPVHCGGIYTTTRDFFDYLQGYDPDMHGFSSENLDFAFRAWLCSKGQQGGRNIVVPCSLVGHVFRMRSPESARDIVTPQKINHNKKRMIETWLDPEGDGNGYTKRSAVRGGPETWMGTCHNGRSCEMPPLLKKVYETREFDLKNIDAGNMSERKKWVREHCKPFSWFIEHVSAPSHAKMPTKF